MSDRWRRVATWPRHLGSGFTAQSERLGGPFGGTRGRALRVVVVVVLGVAGYLAFIRQPTVDRKLLGGLVLDRTALAELPAKPALSESVPPSHSTFAITRTAARRHPAATAVFAREWYVSSSGPPEVGIVIQLLPDASTASRLRSDEVAQLKNEPSLAEETPTEPKRFSVAGVPGARGVSYILDDATTSAHPPVGTSYTVVLQVGRTVTSELMVTTSTIRDDAIIDEDVRAAARLLDKTEPGFSMVRTTWPLVASLVYVGVTLVAAAAAFLGPEVLVDSTRRRRQLRHAREERRDREQYLARGRRTVRRQRAPAWTQPRRR